jgi:hypothetical protein
MKTVHIVVKAGFVENAFCSDPNVEVVVYDLDCQDPEEKAYLEDEVKKLERTLNVIDVF